jgi:hypothetical protein
VFKASLEDPILRGAIVTHELGAGGADYQVNDTFNIDNGSFQRAEGVVDTIDGGGAVLTYHLTSAGANYPVSDAQETAGSPNGTGLTIDVLTITPGDGLWRCKVLYEVFDLS